MAHQINKHTDDTRNGTGRGIRRLHVYLTAVEPDGQGCLSLVGGLAGDVAVYAEHASPGFKMSLNTLGRLKGYRVKWAAKTARGWRKGFKSELFSDEDEARAFAAKRVAALESWMDKQAAKVAA